MLRFKFKVLAGLLFLLCLVSYFSSNAQYCPNVGTCDDHFVNITIGAVNVVNTRAGCVDSSGYMYHFQDTIFLKPSDVVQVAFSVSAQAQTIVHMFLDANLNGAWEIPDEMTPLLGGGVTLREGAIVVAPDQALGNSRLRFLVTLNSTDPCDVGAWQVVDFPVKYTNTGSAYCAATGTCASTYFIQNVSMTGDGTTAINNSSVCESYGDFTSKRATVSPGNQYTVDVKADMNVYYSVASVYVDWNDDKTFSETEQYPGIKKTSLDGYTFTVVPPDSMNSGFKRMRIRNTLLLTTPSPCGQQNDGEVEDYTLYYINPDKPLPDCVTATFPANASFDNCLHQELSWSAAANADLYKVSLVQAGTVIIKDSITTLTKMRVPKVLQPGLIYQWLVIGVNPNGTSVGCDTLFFATSPNADPLVSIAPVSTVKACENVPLQLQASVTAGTAPFQPVWTGLNGSSISNLSDDSINNPFFTATAGTYKYRCIVTDDNGCSGSDSVYIQVSANPVKPGLSLVDSTICLNDTVKFILSKDSTVYHLTWQDSIMGGAWASVVDIVKSGNQFSLAGVNVSAYYRVLVTDTTTTCSAISNVKHLEVFELPVQPVVDVFPGTDLCEGEQATLSTTSADILLWNDTQGSSNDSIQVSSSGSYYVVATNEPGCSIQSQPVQLTFKPLPAKPEISATTTLPCDGNAILLTASGSDPIVWDDAAQTSGNQLSVTQSGGFTAKATAANGCTNSSDVYVILFYPIPDKPVVSSSVAIPACVGDTVELSTTGEGKFKWDDSNSTDSTHMKVRLAGNYSVTVTDSNGCKNVSLPFAVSFNPLPPKPSIFVSSAGPYCPGDSVEFYTLSTDRITWSTGEQSQTILVTESGVLKVTFTDDNGCSSISDSLVINFSLKPDKPTISRVGDTLIANPVATSYQWYDNNGPIAGETSKSYKSPTGGFYSVVVFSADGCPSDSATFYYSGVGISEFILEDRAIYPNPANHELIIDLSQLPLKGVEIRLTDLVGKQLKRLLCTEDRTVLNVEDLSAGNYLLQISSQGESITRHIIIAR